MVFTIARPTRPPGKYKVIWDGKDDHGKPVARRRVHDPHRRRARAWDLPEHPQAGDPGRQAVHRGAQGRRRDQGGLDRVSPQGPGEAVTVRETRAWIDDPSAAGWPSGSPSSCAGCISTCPCSAWRPSSSSAPPASRSTTPTGSSARPSGASRRRDHRSQVAAPPGAAADSPRGRARRSVRPGRQAGGGRALRKAHGIRGALADFKVDDSECTVTLQGPRLRGRRVHRPRLGPLHPDPVVPRRDRHPQRPAQGPRHRAGLVHPHRRLGHRPDVFISLTGLVLLFYLKLRRVPGLVVVVVGAVVRGCSLLPGSSLTLRRTRALARVSDSRPGISKTPCELVARWTPSRSRTSRRDWKRSGSWSWPR